MGRTKEQVKELFDSYVDGRLEEFLRDCGEELVVTAHGSSRTPATLTKPEIPDWVGSLEALSPTTLKSSVEVAHIAENAATVVLRHTFRRDSTDHLLEMVNFLVFRDGLLVAWSSYPIDLLAYSRAWRTHDTFVLEPA